MILNMAILSPVFLEADQQHPPQNHTSMIVPKSSVLLSIRQKSSSLSESYSFAFFPPFSSNVPRKATSGVPYFNL